ncbi:hypothetical protein VNO77_06732 [Canavalia gladiata]|uniref:Uncharacterized protein n=1 Tax=Canavalia gladiata TaxID=3824 RepID=A0AAN9R076_CANGL
MCKQRKVGPSSFKPHFTRYPVSVAAYPSLHVGWSGREKTFVSSKEEGRVQHDKKGKLENKKQKSFGWRGREKGVVAVIRVSAECIREGAKRGRLVQVNIALVVLVYSF